MRRVVAFAGVVSALVLTGFSNAGEHPPPRPARFISLLIGVGNYQHAGDSAWREMNLANLKGPRNDVVLMGTALRNRGFHPGPYQKTLVDSRASKAAIRQAFKWVAEQATDPKDVVVIYYAGHGSWALDRNGDEAAGDEAAGADRRDKWDEGLVPWDAENPQDPDDLVLDDEIGAWLGSIRTENVTVIIDACFSGTVTRGAPDRTSSSGPVARGPRPPPYESPNGLIERGRRMRHTLLTAASSSQTALEDTFYPGGIVLGMFTKALTEALEGAGPNTRFDDLLQHVRTQLGEEQTPQLEGDRTARIFRVGAGVVVPARGFALVERPDPRMKGPAHVGLDVGSIHGVRAGALYDIYPPGETAFAGGSLGQVSVDSILEASSYAVVLPGARAIPEGARATLSRVPPGALALDKLTLFIHPNASALRDSLTRLSWIRVTDRQPAMAELRRSGEVYQVLVGGHDVAPLWDDDAAGRSIAPGPGSVRGFRGSAAVLCLPLRRAFAIAAMNLVRNEQPPPRTQLRLDVRVLPASVTRPTRDTSTVDTVALGGRYNIWAWVQVPDTMIQRLYLSVGIAGYSDTASVIWPGANRAQQLLTPEQLSRPFVVARFPVADRPGIEKIRAVVGSYPYDLGPIVRRLHSCSGEYRGTRLLAGADTLRVTGWTAIIRRVELHPRP